MPYLLHRQNQQNLKHFLKQQQKLSGIYPHHLKNTQSHSVQKENISVSLGVLTLPLYSFFLQQLKHY